MTVTAGNGIAAGVGVTASIQGVIASSEDRRGLQLIQNYKFAADLAGWSADPAYARKTEAGFNGGNPFIEYNGVSGNFDNFTTSNDAASGLQVEPATTYIVSGTRTASFTGNYPQLQINTGADDGLGHAFPGTTLASSRFVAAATETRWSLQFTTGADTKKVWLRFQGLGGVGRLRLMNLNLTKDAIIQPYRDYFYNGK
jgi:poly(3-hydroxybutyrate) depolymerase